MKRPMTPEDLRDKGVPFACNNCGAKPTAEDVVRLNGNCDVCGDEIIAYTIDTAQLLIRLQANDPLTRGSPSRPAGVGGEVSP